MKRCAVLFFFACSDRLIPDVPLVADTSTTLDADGDGDVYADCDDNDPRVAHGLIDVPYDGLDNDCDCGDVVDVDQDGFAALAVGGRDCDDEDATLYPGIADHDARCPAEPDADGDGARVDCDDSRSAVGPAQAEIPGNGVDDDCDGGDHFVVQQADQQTFLLSEAPVDGTLRVWVLNSANPYLEGAEALERCCGSACFLYARTDPTTVTLAEFVPRVGASVFITYDIAPAR